MVSLGHRTAAEFFATGGEFGSIPVACYFLMSFCFQKKPRYELVSFLAVESGLEQEWLKVRP